MAVYQIDYDNEQKVDVSLGGYFEISREHDGAWPKGAWNPFTHSTFYQDNRASEETKRELARLVLIVYRKHQIAPETLNVFDLMQSTFVLVTPKVRDAIQAVDSEACEFFPIPQIYCRTFEEELGHRDYHAMNPLRRLQSWDLEETDVRLTYTAKGRPLTDVRFPGKIDPKTVAGGFIWRDHVTREVFCDDRFVECLDGIDNLGAYFRKYRGS